MAAKYTKEVQILYSLGLYSGEVMNLVEITISKETLTLIEDNLSRVSSRLKEVHELCILTNKCCGNNCKNYTMQLDVKTLRDLKNIIYDHIW